MKAACYFATFIGVLSTLSCHTLPEPVALKSDYSLKPATYGPVADAADQMQAGKKPSASSFVPLQSNKDALDMRLALIDSAAKSIDIQLFIWMEDYTGCLLMERILMAADKGVKVRLLLDDLILGISYSDRELAAIQSHPNVELRLYNPNALRDRMLARVLDMWVNVEKRNQRMHNKTIIADGRLAIISGRNIGDHYFGYGGRYNLVDFGSLVSGGVMTEINAGFDRYWNSESVYDVRAFARVGRTMSLHKLRRVARQKIANEKVPAVRRLDLARQDWRDYLNSKASKAYLGYANYYEDAPDVPSCSRPVIAEVIRMCESAEKEIVVVTPYLVPDQRFMTMLRSARKKGVRIVFLVPTVASNNHMIVHNQYQKYRKVLLGLGVEIYEFRHRPQYRVSPFINEGEKPTHKVGLHAKFVVVDSQVTYFGSINFDGRAIFVNTEEGIIVRSRAMSAKLRSWVDLLKHPQNAWELSLDQNARINWRSGEVIRTQEPSRNFAQAFFELMLRPLYIRHAIFPDHQVYGH